MSEFAQHGLHSADGTVLTTEQRLALTLVGDVSPRALTTALAGKITKERIRYAMAELAAMNVDNVHKWLGQVAEQSPAKAVELFMALLEFSSPKLKAIAVDVRSGDGSVKTLSYAELEARVVSSQ